MFDKPKKEAEKPAAKASASPAPSKPAPASSSNSGQTTTIGASIKLNGELNGDEDLLIQGRSKAISTSSSTISPSASRVLSRPMLLHVPLLYAVP